ncbi:MAG: NADH-quinone oxidoreductase subunit N, partial [Anaerolineales bacterium]|nr:NADH-quinone oxidoreductase subunit N [Anaerolineales bacterium]
MFSGSFDMSMVLAILPEILLLSLAVLVLVLDLVLSDRGRGNLGWVTAGGLAFIIGVSLFAARPESEPRLIWGGMLRQDWMGFFFLIMFLFAAAITALFSVGLPKIGNRGEFYFLMLVSTLGMSLMAASADLIMLYLAIETTAIPLYVLAGFLKQDDKSTEAGFKYLIFGAMTSAIMLYGFSLLYGFTGTTNIYALGQEAQMAQISVWVLLGILLLVLVGFGFKISAVPYHFWVPDVYEGAPTPVTGLVSTASKAAGFAVFLRVCMLAFPSIDGFWAAVLALISMVTITLGNVAALTQENIKRLLAYSSLAQIGYVLMGVVAGTERGITASAIYLLAYTFMNLGIWAGVILLRRKDVPGEKVEDFDGLYFRHPAVAVLMLVFFLSLAGIPPLAGFIAKYYVFTAVLEVAFTQCEPYSSLMVWLAVVG